MQETNLMNLTLKSINLGGVRNSSLALAGSPFGSANRCVSDFAIALSKFLASLGTSYVRKTLSEMPAIALMEDDKDVEYNSV